MHVKKHLNLENLVGEFRKILDRFPESRNQGVDYPLADIVLSGFACMFFQDPSLLQFQKRMEKEKESSNLKTLFGVANVPESTQLRTLIDTIPARNFSAVFKRFFHLLQRGKHLEQFQFYRGKYLLSIDGTQYFSSTKISCEHCLRREHKNGERSFSHQALQGAMMHPDMKQVIPLMAEDIRNEDGASKQDCEINAAKRFVSRFHSEHPQLDTIILGDSLFSKQPMIENLREKGLSYIFGVKPGDHKILFEDLAQYDQLNESRIEREDGRTCLYRWMNGVPLNGGEDSITVNFFEIKILAPDRHGNFKTNLRSSWVTDFPISGESVERLVRAARCRWKIENECFNNLKNQGYHLEHNFGHGKEYLSFNFYLLTLLAFFTHQIFELTDKLFQACRKKLGSKRHLWEKIRTYIDLFIFDSWQLLLQFVFEPKSFNPSLRPP